MRTPWRFLMSLGLSLLLLHPGLLLGATATSQDPISKDLYQQLDLFTQVLHDIQNDYIEPVSEEQLIQGAIRGMVETLDPHSQYMVSEEYEELKDDTKGRFGGIGVEIAMKDDKLMIVTPIEGSPAAAAGLKTGDLILEINGIPTRNRPLMDVIKEMRGDRGTQVTLMIGRGDAKPFRLTLERDRIKVKSVRTELIDQDLGYMRIASFQEGTSSELERGLRRLEHDSKEHLRGIILDLRNNPGGLLDEAVAVSDIFLESGKIVSMQGREKEPTFYEAKADGTVKPYPLIVLVNGGSASAAEIVAGALQDHKRAVVLGAQTFGKGSVQTVYELDKGQALKLTISRYYTPSGRSIQASGIKPDIVVETPAEASAIQLEKRVVSEKDLAGHLDGPGEATVPETSADEDFQKKAAVTLMKSWKLFGTPGA